MARRKNRAAEGLITVPFAWDCCASCRHRPMISSMVRSGVSKYATAEKRFGIESRLPVVLIVTERETPSPFEEVTMRGRRSAWTITLDFQSRTTLQHWLQRRKTPV